MTTRQSITPRLRPPWWRNLLMVVAVLTLLLPIDALPDLAPVIGWLDDLVAGLYLVSELITRLRRRS